MTFFFFFFFKRMFIKKKLSEFSMKILLTDDVLFRYSYSVILIDLSVFDIII